MGQFCESDQPLAHFASGNFRLSSGRALPPSPAGPGRARPRGIAEGRRCECGFPGKDEARTRLALLAIDPRTDDSGHPAELENYLRQRPNDPAAFARLAALRQRDGKPDQAIKTYEKIIAGDRLYAPPPGNSHSLYAEHSQDVAKADDLALKARQEYPDDAEVAQTLGILSYDEAKSTLGESTDNIP
jgi:hypothetical protein